jgi:hypothetical protein
MPLVFRTARRTERQEVDLQTVRTFPPSFVPFVSLVVDLLAFPVLLAPAQKALTSDHRIKIAGRRNRKPQTEKVFRLFFEKEREGSTSFEK